MSCQYIQAIKDTYDGIVSVKTIGGEPVSFSLHRLISTTFKPMFFTLVVDELTWLAHNEILWCMLSANDIMLVEKTYRAINSLS